MPQILFILQPGVGEVYNFSLVCRTLHGKVFLMIVKVYGSFKTRNSHGHCNHGTTSFGNASQGILKVSVYLGISSTPL